MVRYLQFLSTSQKPMLRFSRPQKSLLMCSTPLDSVLDAGRSQVDQASSAPNAQRQDPSSWMFHPNSLTPKPRNRHRETYAWKGFQIPGQWSFPDFLCESLGSLAWWVGCYGCCRFTFWTSNVKHTIFAWSVFPNLSDKPNLFCLGEHKVFS